MLMFFGSYTGSLGYVVPLWIATGALILLTDKKSYQLANLSKEAKMSTVLGWFNITLGVLLIVVSWIARHIG